MEIIGLKPIQALVATHFFKVRRLILVLPRQEGKTEIGVRMMRSFLDVPETRGGLFLAKDTPSAKKASGEKFDRLFEKEIFNVNTEKVARKDKKSAVCYFQGVDKDPDRMRGGTYGFIHWSEAAFAKLQGGATVPLIYQLIIDPTLRVTNGLCLIESTKNGKNGFKELWDMAPEIGFSTLCVGLSQLRDMGLVTLEEYNRIKGSTHPDVFKQEYECEWVSFQGRAYPEINESTIDPNMPNPEDWQMVAVSIDWGWNPSATCVLFAYVRGKIIHVFDEIYELEQLPQATADAIRSRFAGYGIEKYTITGDHDKARNEELERRDLPVSLAKKSDVMGNRMEIKELLHFGRLKIHPRCKMLLRDLESSTWDGKKDGEIDYGQCTWGHYDGEAALRYLVRELKDHEEKEPLRNPHPEGSPAWFEWNMRYGRR